MKRLCVLLLILCTVSGPARAAYFDCAVVYDEFESLMNKQFLVEPDRYVTTITDRLTIDEFQRLQRGRFSLYKDRAGSGIIIFRSNENLHGKLLFHFNQAANNEMHLILDEGVIFARVADGYGPFRFGPLRVKPNFGVDLDTGDGYVLFDESSTTREDKEKQLRVDLAFHLDKETGELVVEAANEAALYFPIETLCHRPGASPQPGANRAPPSAARSPSSARSMPLPAPPPALDGVPQPGSVRQP